MGALQTFLPSLVRFVIRLAKPRDLTWIVRGIQATLLLLAFLIFWKWLRKPEKPDRVEKSTEPPEPPKKYIRNFGVDGLRCMSVFAALFEHTHNVPDLSATNAIFVQHWVINLLFLATAYGFLVSSQPGSVIKARFLFLWCVGMVVNMTGPTFLAKPFQPDFAWMPHGYHGDLGIFLLHANHQFWYCLIAIVGYFLLEPLIKLMSMPEFNKWAWMYTLFMGVFGVVLGVIAFLRPGRDPIKFVAHFAEPFLLTALACVLAYLRNRYTPLILMMVSFGFNVLWAHSPVSFFFSRPCQIMLIGIMGYWFPLFTPRWRHVRSYLCLIIVAGLMLCPRPGWFGKCDWYPPGNPLSKRFYRNLHLGIDESSSLNLLMLRAQYYSGEFFFLLFGLAIMNLARSTVKFSGALQNLSLFLYIFHMVLLRVIPGDGRFVLGLVPMVIIIGGELVSACRQPGIPLK